MGQFKQVFLICSMLLMAWGSVVAQEVLSPSLQPTKRNTLALAAASANVPAQCKSVLDFLGSTAIADATKNDLLYDWDRFRQVNATFALMLMELPNNRTGVMSIAALPQSDGSCTVMAERVTTTLQSCKDYAKNQFKDYNESQLLPNILVYVSKSDPGSSVTLLNSNPGCLIVRRYVNFYASAQKMGGR